jgi:hypothetical protein
MTTGLREVAQAKVETVRLSVSWLLDLRPRRQVVDVFALCDSIVCIEAAQSLSTSSGCASGL